MTNTYQINGMTCSGCVEKIKSSLLLLSDISDVEVNKDDNSAILSMKKQVSLAQLQAALGGVNSKYQINPLSSTEILLGSSSFLEIYKPIFLIFGYVIVVAMIAGWQHQAMQWMTFMRVFMSGFFLSFSFFKLINLKGFADSYAMYDVVAKRFKPWGYFYAFIELGLGVGYAINFNPQLINSITMIVMLVSVLGVLESVLNKRKIKCACLGAVFNLPMSTITIIEDFLMIAMSAAMLILI